MVLLQLWLVYKPLIYSDVYSITMYCSHNLFMKGIVYTMHTFKGWPFAPPIGFELCIMLGLASGVASLDLMLGHTFYNRPCLATGMLVHTWIYIIMVIV